MHGKRISKSKCKHPFDRQHWVGKVGFCNACKTTLKIK